MFSKIVTDVYGLLASQAWATGVGLPAYPVNYKGEVANTGFVRVHIIPLSGERAAYAGSKRRSGMVIFTVFHPAGKGDLALASAISGIASLLENKTLPNGTQFSVGAVGQGGTDPINSSLYAVEYSINFQIFGD